MASDPPRQYSQEEVSEILRRALARQHSASEVTHQELVDAAREVGVSDAELHAAAAEIEAERARDSYRAVARRRALWRFVSGVLVFAAVNVAIRTVAAAAAVVAAMPWLYIVLVLWAIGLATQLLRVVFPGAEAERQRRRAERRAARDAARQARSVARAQRSAQQRELGVELAHNAEEFGTAVQRGVSTLLAALAREINAHVAQSNAGGGAGAPPPAAGAAREQQGEPPRREQRDEDDERAAAAAPRAESTWVRVNAAAEPEAHEAAAAEPPTRAGGRATTA